MASSPNKKVKVQRVPLYAVYLEGTMIHEHAPLKELLEWMEEDEGAKFEQLIIEKTEKLKSEEDEEDREEGEFYLRLVAKNKEVIMEDESWEDFMQSVEDMCGDDEEEEEEEEEEE